MIFLSARCDEGCGCGFLGLILSRAVIMMVVGVKVSGSLCCTTAIQQAKVCFAAGRTLRFVMKKRIFFLLVQKKGSSGTCNTMKFEVQIKMMSLKLTALLFGAYLGHTFKVSALCSCSIGTGLLLWPRVS